ALSARSTRSARPNGRVLRISALIITLLLAGATSGCGSDSAPPERIVIAGGVDGGVYARYAAAMDQALTASLGHRVQVSVLSTAGSVDNLQRLAAGSATFAICAADAVADARLSEAARPASAPTDYRAVARLYDDYIHLVVKADSPIRGLPDLRGRRVAVGGPTSGTAFAARRILSAAGLSGQSTESELGLSEGLDALDRGEVDAVFWSGGLPTGRVADAAHAERLRLLSLGDTVPPLRAEYGTVYHQGRIPAETYAGVDGVDTIAFPDLLMTTSQTSDRLVREVVTALFAHPEVIGRVPTGQLLNRAEAIFTEPVPLHKAALDYFRQEKVATG
ncbi:MAG: TAXI family TRAP transporter solute-binding subunit, partial [Catenulispora sp.]|nr:TAXI family TRAP transporter solute-binding subunit [Catenulispora sp.]